MATMIIDGKDYLLPDSEKLNVIQAASRAGIEIPYFCWHPALSVVANCRMCEVEVGSNPPALGLSGEEVYRIEGLADALTGRPASGRRITVHAHRPDGATCVFPATVRIDTPHEAHYYEHGGILQFALRQMLNTE
jgi:hypothetical protein